MTALGEVDALDVEKAAEDRVGASREQRRQEVEADVHLGDVAGGEPDLVEDRLEVIGLVGDPRGRHRLALQVADVGDPGLGERDQRGERAVDERRDGHHRQALLLGEQNLGLV